jgi:predicted DNA-binding transcriptional regulator AlpA
MEPLLTFQDVAELLKVSRQHVYHLVKLGRIPPPLYLTDDEPRFRVCDLREAAAKLAEESRQHGGQPRRPRGKKA